jgi:hypothetical protein
LKQQVAAIRSTRESLCPYPPEIKRELIEHALDELKDCSLLQELSDKLGLEWGLLVRWLREALPQEVSAQSDE